MAGRGKQSKRKQRQKQKAARAGRPNPALVEQAMLKRVLQRVALSFSVKLPAVPALAEHYRALLGRSADAVGRSLSHDELQQAALVISGELERAFAFSQRSKVELRVVAPPGMPVDYEICAERRTLSDTYEHWLGPDESALFGKQADARVLSAACELGEPTLCPVLDFGAGTGRNALALARLGHPVDAVEITARFAQMIARDAETEGLRVRSIVKDVFRDRAELRTDYRMLFASEVASDFRGTGELSKLFQLAHHVLDDGGLLLFNAHVACPGYTPDRATREFAQHCYSALYTTGELAQAAEALPFEFVAADAAAAYERQHLPSQAWPPTAWFENWATGRDIFELERGRCPVALYWLAFRKREGTAGQRQLMARALGAAIERQLVSHEDASRAAVCLEPETLRAGLLSRMKRRAVARGQLVLPAVPALSERLLKCCRDCFRALGRDYSEAELSEFGRELVALVTEGFDASPRSEVNVDFELPMGRDLSFELSRQSPSIQAVYEDWHACLPPPLFGEHHDARLESLLAERSELHGCPVLDLGAGLGRNAFWLAARGHSVDAVEFTPAFATELQEGARRRGLPLRVVGTSCFEAESCLRRDYGLVLCSGVVADLRNSQELVELFLLVGRQLRQGGLLLLSAHVGLGGYEPGLALEQWAQQCAAMCYSEAALRNAARRSDLDELANDSARDFEKQHLPLHAWPPTPVFEEWASARHMLDVSRSQTPLALRWLVYQKL